MNKLKQIRLDKGYTLEELARKSKTSISYICQVETGHRNMLTMRASTLNKLCKALGCEVSDLISLDDVFTYIDGNLLCDEIYFYGYKAKHSIMVKINGAFYYPPDDIDRKKKIHEQLIKHNAGMGNGKNIKKASEDKNVRSLAYMRYGLILRDSYKVELGRAITNEELQEFGFYNKEFIFKDVAGKEYGPKSGILYDAIQVGTTKEIIQEMKKRGIQVNELFEGYVNIRIS